jgi:hypothetical protein
MTRMDEDIIVTLKRSNDLLMMFGNDYSDVFLPAIDEIERSRKILSTVLEACEDVNSPDRKVREEITRTVRKELKEKSDD